MRYKVRKLLKTAKLLVFIPLEWLRNVYFSISKKQTYYYFLHSFNLFYDCLEGLYTEIKKSKNFIKVIDGTIQDPNYEKNRKRVLGLHSLLSKEKSVRYSLLMPVYKPNPRFFREAVLAAVKQTAPHFELLLGYDGEQPKEVYEVIQNLRAEGLDPDRRIVEVQVDRKATGGGISATTNAIAKKATGDYLVLMDHDDWLRPELLYRYEQVMKANSYASHLVLFCDEYKIDENDVPIPNTATSKEFGATMPYLFINTICHCLAIPKSLWEKVGGLRSVCDGAQDFDLCLRLDQANAKFIKIPIHLYAWRSHENSTAKIIDQKDYATQAGIRALSDYCQQRKPHWKIEKGIQPTSYRAIPELGAKPKVLALVPFKNQFEMTKRAIQTALAQEGVEVSVTAIDNHSDGNFAEHVAGLRNVEVLRVAEPFNFSRLNNLGFLRSKFRDQADLVLFLNNDVALDPGSVLEMSRWALEPEIGIVGNLLRYPNGTIQHGGIELALDERTDQNNWMHRGHGCPIQSDGFHLMLTVVDAVTGACAMMRKSVFEEVGFFDEDFYPVAFSDTDLCTRIQQKGYYCFYTPFSTALHEESASRGYHYLEELELGTWFSSFLKRNPLPNKYLWNAKRYPLTSGHPQAVHELEKES